jgi:heme oxygenase
MIDRMRAASDQTEPNLRARKSPPLNRSPPQVRGQVSGTFSPLSTRLREETAPLHRRIEAVLELPDAIQNREDYRAWLCRYLGFYEPLERSFGEFSDWESLGIELARHAQSGRLREDLATLGAGPEAIPHASSAMLPQLPRFAHALGSLYVIEGARLGGRAILRQLERRIGPAIAGATCFLGGCDDAGGLSWQSFRAMLDDCGKMQPQRCADVVTGAKRTFIGLENWFAPFCAGKAAGHERR